MHCQLRNEFGYVLWRKKLASTFSGIGGIVGNQELVSITKKVNLVVFKIAEVQLLHTFQDGCQTAVFGFNAVAQAGAGGVKVGKEAFNVNFGGVSIGRAFNGVKNGL